jgi:hypothetical protein
VANVAHCTVNGLIVAITFLVNLILWLLKAWQNLTVNFFNKISKRWTHRPKGLYSGVHHVSDQRVAELLFWTAILACVCLSLGYYNVKRRSS